jgi:hypothetical protein
MVGQRHVAGTLMDDAGAVGEPSCHRPTPYRNDRNLHGATVLTSKAVQLYAVSQDCVWRGEGSRSQYEPVETI